LHGIGDEACSVALFVDQAHGGLLRREVVDQIDFAGVMCVR